MRLWEYLKRGGDPTNTAVLMEDSGAVAGLLIAGVCTALAHWTGNAAFDAAGSIAVGLLLGVIASFLVQKNRQLLIGRSMQPREVAAVLEALRCDPVVLRVIDAKTEEVGMQLYRFKAEVDWAGEQVVERYLERCGREALLARCREASASGDAAALEAWLKEFGRDIISAVGAETDRIEVDIARLNPGIKWVDLETDRGRSERVRTGWGIPVTGSFDGGASGSPRFSFQGPSVEASAEAVLQDPAPHTVVGEAVTTTLPGKGATPKQGEPGSTPPNGKDKPPQA